MSKNPSMLPRLMRAALLSLVCALLTLGLTRIASATIYYVATTGSNFNTGLSWSSPKSNLQSTITAAHSGDQVWVEYGTYTGNFTATDGVAVYGHFAGTETNISQRQLTNTADATILDANSSGTVYTIPGSASNTNTLDGFTLENGSATGNGGGIYDGSSDSLVLSNDIFTGNQANSATGFGGGIYSSTSCTITNCVLSTNSALKGGAFATAGASATITNSTFTDNSSGASYSGGIDNLESSLTVTGCTFTGNTTLGAGGAISVAGSTTVENCAFTDNNATGFGGAININASFSVLTVEDCTFTGNSAASGGGIYTSGGGGGMLMANGSAFTDNTATGDGGGIYGNNSADTITDCAFTGNTAVGDGGGIDLYEGSGAIARCTLSGNSPDAIFATGTGVSTQTSVKDSLIVGSGATTAKPSGINIDTVSSGNTDYVTIANDTIVMTNVGINIGSSYGTITVANTILDGNYGGLNSAGSAGFVSSHNDVHGNASYGYQGASLSSTDLEANPVFVSSSDYQLQSTSPLIGAGDPLYATSGDTDLNDNPRVIDGKIDIGCYEYDGPPIPASVTFSPATVLGGAATTGTVTLAVPAPTGGAIVTLTSSNTSAAPVPASVIVPAGATSATFKITTGTVTASTNVTITAKLNGTSVTGTLTVAPQGIASVTLSSYTITGGDALTGSVNLLYPAATNTVVTLAPGGSDSVPASVTVKANTTTATFTVLTSAVPAKIGASVLATLNGKSVKGGFTLLPPQVATLVIAPNAVMGGTPVSATVVLNVPAPSGGIVVTLTSSNSAEASVPASVTVPAGSYVATFPVTTYAVTGYTRVTIDSETTALVGAASVTLLP